MEKLDLPVLILLAVFIGVVAAFFVFYLRGNLNYSSSAAPEVLGKLKLFWSENWIWMVGVLAGIVLVIILMRAGFAIWRRVNRKEINAGILRRVEREVLG